MTTESFVEPRHLGSIQSNIFPLALGCIGVSGAYGSADDDESINTIHMALESGINLLYTGDFYGAGQNELLIGRALKDPLLMQPPSLFTIYCSG